MLVYGQPQTINHIVDVESYPLTKLADDGLPQLHSGDNTRVYTLPYMAMASKSE